MEIDKLERKREEVQRQVQLLESGVNEMRQQLAQAERNLIACQGAVMVIDQLLGKDKPDSPSGGTDMPPPEEPAS
jgi:septal ring factor EnvC (AmiA/AmiB activator)